MGLDHYLYTNSRRVKRDAEKAETDAWERECHHKDDIVITWRKANHIHRWFVENVQGGEDDQGFHEVDVEQLRELADRCREVLASSKLVPTEVEVEKYVGGKRVKVKDTQPRLEDCSVAEELLPTMEGFFFGDLSYGEWYVENTKRTLDMLDAALENVVRDDESEFPWHFVHRDEPDWHVRFQYSSWW